MFRETIGEIVRDNTILVNIGEGRRVGGRPNDMVKNKYCSFRVKRNQYVRLKSVNCHT